MKIGLNLPVMVPGFDRDTILEWSRRIDAGPFSSIAAGERVCFPNPEMMVTMSAAAAVTERVSLQFSVVVLPMHRELHIAKQIATLDVISNGRVILGVGVGGRDEDYAAYDAPTDGKRLTRMEKQVERMRAAWSGENVVEGALRPVEPAPVRSGGPPILAGSMMPKSIRRASRWADGLSGFSFGPDRGELEETFRAAREAWKDAGRSDPPTLVVSCWYGLGPCARTQMDEYLHRYLRFLGPGVAEQLAPSVATDSAEKLRDALAMFEDLGTDEVLFVPTTSDPDEVHRVADLIA